jgi:hypothetical protein
MTEELNKTENVRQAIIGQLRTIEANVIHNACLTARILKLFGEESFSKDGADHIIQLMK